MEQIKHFIQDSHIFERVFFLRKCLERFENSSFYINMDSALKITTSENRCLFHIYYEKYSDFECYLITVLPYQNNNFKFNNKENFDDFEAHLIYGENDIYSYSFCIILDDKKINSYFFKSNNEDSILKGHGYDLKVKIINNEDILSLKTINKIFFEKKYDEINDIINDLKMFS